MGRYKGHPHLPRFTKFSASLLQTELGKPGLVFKLIFTTFLQRKGDGRGKDGLQKVELQLLKVLNEGQHFERCVL